MRYLSLGFVVFLMSFFLPESKAQNFINGFYMFNPVAFNPAIAGVNDQIAVSSIVREQWTGLNGAPNTQSVNAHMPVYSWFDRYDKPGSRTYPTGLSSGLLLINDKIGATQYSRFSFPLSARVRITQSGVRLSLGMRFDVSRLAMDIEDLRMSGFESVSYDPQYFADFATGLYAYHTQWYVGVSMTNMRSVKMSDYGYESEHQYYGSAGFAQPINHDLVLRLTSLVLVSPGNPLSVTVTPAAIIKDNIETGFSYRYDDMYGAFFSFKPINNLKVGCWYEYPTGAKKNQVGATYELVLQMTFEMFKKRVISPRYFW